MKKSYIVPTSKSLSFYMEGDVAGLLIQSGGNGASTNISNDEEILSDKRTNPIWGESNNGMWDNME